MLQHNLGCEHIGVPAMQYVFYLEVEVPLNDAECDLVLSGELITVVLEPWEK